MRVFVRDRGSTLILGFCKLYPLGQIQPDICLLIKFYWNAATACVYILSMATCKL